MTSPARFLRSLNPGPPPPQTPSNDADAVDSDFVVILAALLCALICVLGLVAVARCTWIRRLYGGAGVGSPAPATKGLKKKVLKSLPKMPYSAEQHAGKLADECAICLSEFAVGEEIRVLPQCSHGFHVNCIDTWLGSHSSCPSCRQILAAVPTRCQKCGGGLPETSTSTTNTSSSSGGDAPPAPMVSDSFLP